jgi:enterobacterial common antigen flippase
MDKSYFQIFRATLISGSAAGVCMLLSMIRVKFATVLLGVFGVGLLQSFNSTQGLISSITSLGLQSSSVREISKAFNEGDEVALGKLVLIIRRLCIMTGLCGFIITVILSSVISKLTFGVDNHRIEIASLGLIVLLNNVVIADMALIQGARRIGDLARINILVSSLGTIFAISLYFYLGLKGLIPSLAVISVIQVITAHYYASGILKRKILMPFFSSLFQGGVVLRLGLVVTWTGMLASSIPYLTVALLATKLGVITVGYYSAAFALSGIFVNFILGAMAADYFPRLVAVIEDKFDVTRVINEQSEIALLISTPGVLITLVFAPWILEIAYSSEFKTAYTLMQWFLLGCLGRVISWPLGFALLATRNIRWILFSETIANLIHMMLLIMGFYLFGLNGVGIAFFGLYVFYIPFIYFVCRRLICFQWSSQFFKIFINTIGPVTIIFLMTRFFDLTYVTFLGIFITIATSYYCVREGIVRTSQARTQATVAIK